MAYKRMRAKKFDNNRKMLFSRYLFTFPDYAVKRQKKGHIFQVYYIYIYIENQLKLIPIYHKSPLMFLWSIILRTLFQPFEFLTTEYCCTNQASNVNNCVVGIIHLLADGLLHLGYGNSYPKFNQLHIYLYTCQ